jgi:hypothetical protein
MHTVSVRTMQDLAYERGEEFDPALFAPSDELVDGLALAGVAAPIVEAPSEYERERHNARRRRQALRSIPAWFEAQDLAPLEHIHGEVV